MLDSLRKGAGTWVVRIFLMVLVASFAVWGIGDIFRARSTSGLISVGEREISAAEVSSAFNRELRRLQLQAGNDIDAQQARELGLLQSTVRQMIARGLFDEATRELGLTVSDARLAQSVRDNPGFKDEFGRFDRFQLQRVLRENGFSEQGFLDATRRDMVRLQLLDSLTAGVPAPAVMVDAYYRFQQERRVAELLKIPDADLADVALPDETTLAAYHQSHAARYTAPEYRAISFFTLAPSDLVDEVNVTEEELREAYQDRVDQFTVQARREVEQILADDEAQANEIAERIAGGMDFHAAAQELAGMDADGTRLGEVSPTSLPLPQAAIDAVFALPAGGVSAPVETDLGWHVFRVTKVLAEAQTRSFEEVREQLALQLRLDRAATLMFDFANRIEDAFAAGERVEEVVQRFALTLTQVPAVDRRGLDRAGNAVGELPANPDFLAAVFEEQPGDEPRLRESDVGNYFLVRVDSVTEPAIRPLDEVRDTVVADWIAEQRLEAAETRAAALAGAAGGSSSLAPIQAEAGGDLSTTEPLLRGEFFNQAGLSQDLVQALFRAAPGEVVAGANATGDGRVLARLVEVKPAETGDNPEMRQQLQDGVRQALVEDVRSQFQAALAESYEVSVDQRGLDALFDQTPR